MAEAIREIQVGRVFQSPYREPLYDTIVLPSGTATREARFFQVPQGQPLSTVAGLTFNKTLAQTNIQQAGSAGAGRDHLITGIVLKLKGAPQITGGNVVGGTSPSYSDFLGLYTFSWLELGIGKAEIQVRLDEIPSGLRAEGSIYPASAAGETVLGNGMSLSKEYYSLHIPFKALQKAYGGYMFYKGQQSIVCAIHFEPPFQPSANLLLSCYLLGISNKPL